MKNLFLALTMMLALVSNSTECQSTSTEWLKKGCHLQAQGNHAQALECFTTSLAYEPTNTTALFNLATAHLACSNIERGFELMHEYFTATHPLAKQWHGEDLEGKQVLVHFPAWGYGDSIMFARFIELLKRKGAIVTALAPKGLTSLLSHFPLIDAIVHAAQLVLTGADTVVEDAQSVLSDINTIIDNAQEALENFYLSLPRDARVQAPMHIDYEIHLMSIPALCNAPVADLCNGDYLSNCWNNTQERSITVHDNDHHRQIGICWKSAPRNHPSLSSRSMRCQELQPLLNCPHATFYNLAIDVTPQEYSFLAENGVIDYSTVLDKKSGSFVDTMSLIKHLDLVITVDTAVAHLAGALGKPVWVMLPHVAEWRYYVGNMMQESLTKTLWYPTMRLFQQTEQNQWDSVISQVTYELNNLA